MQPRPAVDPVAPSLQRQVSVYTCAMEARCQCGAVRFTTPLPQPLALYVCHCAECRRQTGSAFGTSAIFPRFSLPQADDLACYKRPTPNGETLYCEYTTTFLASAHEPLDLMLFFLTVFSQNKNVVSVKGGCVDGLDWKSAIHIWTKSAMVPIPEGAETFSEAPSGSEYSGSQETLDQPVDDGPGALLGHTGTPVTINPSVAGGVSNSSGISFDKIRDYIV
ncbi:Mss4-like protein [Xylariales sp. PMI_506]|nr:Mss4-like protein [Xylariales sp. PMI_506]